MFVQAIDRLEHINHALKRDGRVAINKLASELDVSEMTIRRDLEEMASEGLVQKVRGGAIALGAQQFDQRFRHHAKAKAIIAEKLEELVGVGGAIGIDASSTLQRFAAELKNAKDITVVTNGLEAFKVLQNHEGVQPLLTGGKLDHRTGSLVGPIANRICRDLVLRRLFVSSAALDSKLGSSESTLEEAELKLAMAESAQEIILCVDSSKLGHHSHARAFTLDRIDILVTELDHKDPRLDPWRKQCRIQ